MKNRCVLFTLLVIFTLLLPAFGSNVEVLYEPVSLLKFEKGPYPFDASKFVLHIGTLTFISTGNTLFDPTLFALNTSINFTFTGPVAWSGYNYTNQPTTFRMASVSTINGQTGWNYVDSWDHQHSLASWYNGNLNTNPFIAKLYLVSDHSASIYPDYAVYEPSSHGAYYTHTGGSFGGFNIVVAGNNSGHTHSFEYVPVNGQIIPEDGSPPSSQIPFLGRRGDKPSPSDL
ncbi:MAG: hypothetical protein ACQ5SW_00155 [Sphaerochaetaceae bacterium]